MNPFRGPLVALAFYVANNVVASLPSFFLRHLYYRHVLRYHLGDGTAVHMHTFFTGSRITIGNNVIINRGCYLDGRVGVDVGDNVSISPGVHIFSLEHDPTSASFDTRGGRVVIEKNAWIGARATLLPGITVGEGAVVGAGAVVTRNVGAYRVAVGVPAHEIRDRRRDISYTLRYRTWFDTDIQIQRTKR